MPMRPAGLTTSALRGTRGGLTALLLLALAAPSRAATREYFIAAEEVVWDFAPSGQNLVHGGSIPKPYRTKWKKARYIQYTDGPFDTNVGLLGPIVVTAAGMARPDATPKDVDREFVTLFMIFNEARDRERGLMHSINGYIFGNLRGLEMNTGTTVRWYVLGMGNEADLHSPHWHGRTLRYQLRNTDVIELLPGSMATADMVADDPGTWMLHCHVADHIAAGMLTTYTINP